MNSACTKRRPHNNFDSQVNLSCLPSQHTHSILTLQIQHKLNHKGVYVIVLNVLVTPNQCESLTLRDKNQLKFQTKWFISMQT